MPSSTHLPATDRNMRVSKGKGIKVICHLQNALLLARMLNITTCLSFCVCQASRLSDVGVRARFPSPNIGHVTQASRKDVGSVLMHRRSVTQKNSELFAQRIKNKVSSGQTLSIFFQPIKRQRVASIGTARARREEYIHPKRIRLWRYYTAHGNTIL